MDVSVGVSISRLSANTHLVAVCVCMWEWADKEFLLHFCNFVKAGSQYNAMHAMGGRTCLCTQE